MPAIRAALYREIYQFLTAERHGDRPSAASARDVPRPLARALVHFYSLIRTATLRELEDDLADLLAAALSDWFGNLWGELSAPPSGVIPSAPSPGRAPAPTREALTERLAVLRTRYPEHLETWDLMTRRLASATTQVAVGALAADLTRTLADIESQEWNRRLERALRLIATPLADHLNELVPRLADADRECRRVFHRPGNWNVFDDQWMEIDWSAIETARRDLDASPDIERVTETLARGVVPEDTHLVWRRVPREITDVTRHDAGVGDIDGLRGGSGVQLALPDELALLATPETEDLFARKLAEQGVLGLSSNRVASRVRTTTVSEWKRVPADLKPGPILVSMDTSGSMRGTAERVAHSILLGLIRSSLPVRRDVHVLAVRGGLREVSLRTGEDQTGDATGSGFSAAAPSRVDHTTIRSLERFLAAPPLAGADVAPALDAALQRIDRNAGTVTDLVIISDMRFPRIGPVHRRQILELQQRGLITVHAITIGEEPMHDPMNTFDHRWHYNTHREDILPGSTASPMLGFRRRV